MKKTLFVSMILVVFLALSACSSAASLPGAAVGKVIQSAMNGLEAATATPDGTEQLSALQIAVGTLKLNGTTQAITAEQAAELLPLWQAIQERQSKAPQGGPQGTPQGTPQGKPQMSGTPAASDVQPEARNDEFQSIRDVLTEEQLQAIADMNLTYDTMTAYLTEQGIELPEMQQMPGGDASQAMMTPPANGQRPTPDASVTLTPRPTPSGDEKPANGDGGPRSGGMGPNGAPAGQGNGTPPSMSGTPGADQGGPDGAPRGGRGEFVPSAVVDAVIQYLEGITA